MNKSMLAKCFTPIAKAFGCHFAEVELNKQDSSGNVNTKIAEQMGVF